MSHHPASFQSYLTTVVTMWLTCHRVIISMLCHAPFLADLVALSLHAYHATLLLPSKQQCPIGSICHSPNVAYRVTPLPMPTLTSFAEPVQLIVHLVPYCLTTAHHVQLADHICWTMCVTSSVQPNTTMTARWDNVSTVQHSVRLAPRVRCVRVA